MAQLVDSEEVFASRLKSLELEDFKHKFQENRWTTIATFAYSSSYVPGSSDDSVFQADIVLKIFNDLMHDKIPVLRRLHFECCTLMASDFKNKVEGFHDGDGRKRKSASVELVKRISDLKGKYNLFDWANPQFDLAHKPIDDMHEMKCLDRLEYVEPWKMPTREQEMQCKLVDEHIKKEANGVLRVEQESKLPDAETHADLRLKNAYTRKGFSFEAAMIMMLTTHEKLVNKMFQAFELEPPPGYAQVSLQQIAAADRKAFHLLQAKTLGDLGRKYACDRHMDAVLCDPAFVTLLLPLQNPNGPVKQGPEVIRVPDEEGTSKTKLKKTIAELKAKLEKTKDGAGSGGGAGGKPSGDGGSGRGGSGGKGTKPKQQATVPAWTPSTGAIRMPRELHGLSPMKDGERICFAFNCSNGCNHTNCHKGLHVCMRCWSTRHGANWQDNGWFVCKQAR